MMHSAAHPCQHSSRVSAHVHTSPHARRAPTIHATRPPASAHTATPAAASHGPAQPPLPAAAGTGTNSTSLTASSRLRSLSRAPWIAAPLDQPPIARFRFWIDEKRFKGDGDSSLAQAALLAAGGVRVGGNFKAAAVQGPLGWQVPDQWDVLWSPSDSAAKAASQLRQGQLISAVPGLRCLTRKQNLSRTLAAAYGPAAWRLMPLTFALPGEVAGWRQALQQEAQQLVEAARQQQQQHQEGQQQQAQQGEPLPPRQQQQAASSDSSGGSQTSSSPSSNVSPSGLWVLKTVEHLGQGLLVVPGRSALRLMLERNQAAIQRQMAAQQALEGPPAPQQQLEQQQQQQQQQEQLPSQRQQQQQGQQQQQFQQQEQQPPQQQQQQADQQQPSKSEPRPFVAAQQYISNPLLIQGRKFGLRLWCVVIGGPPLRSYLHPLGLVLFSSQDYTLEGVRQPDGVVAPGHLTNHAQNKDAPVWSLQQLQQHLGSDTWARLWAACCSSAAQVVAAAVPTCNQAARDLGLPPDSCFELLGLDYLVDEELHPWLMEVNATPSLAWDHPDPASAALMAQHKSDMLADMVTLLRLQDKLPGQPAAGSSSAGRLQNVSTPAPGGRGRLHRGSTPAEAAAAADPLKAGTRAGGRRSDQVPSQQEEAAQPDNARAVRHRRKQQQQQLSGPLLEAAKQYYLLQDDRSEVLQRVMAAASKLAAAQSAAPTRQQAEAQLAAITAQVAARPGAKMQPTEGGESEDSPEVSLLLQHQEQLMGVVAEVSSPGNWVCMQDYMPSSAEAQQQGWQIQYSDVDLALQQAWAGWCR